MGEVPIAILTLLVSIKSRVGNPRIPDTEKQFLTSFVVLPETPLGAIAIMGSSLAGISAYAILKRHS